MKSSTSWCLGAMYFAALVVFFSASELALRFREAEAIICLATASILQEMERRKP